MHSTKLNRWQGVGLVATTLLGTGVFILPQMTIAIADQGALMAWLLLTVAVIPITWVFGKLSALLPHAAGPAHFVEKAFGLLAGRTIGLIFLLVVPLGIPAALLMTFQFVNALVQLSAFNQLISQLGILVLIYLLNFRGIQVSAKLQFILTISIIFIVCLLISFIGSYPLPEIIISTEQLFNSSLIFSAVGIAFWSFLGIEAMTHLANDFQTPKKDLLPAMMIGTVIVGFIYLTCTWLLILVPATNHLAMVGVFDLLIGDHGALFIGAIGLAGGLASVNVYTASLARLAHSLSIDGVLPHYFSKVNKHQIPQRALTALLGIMALVLMATYFSNSDITLLISWCNGVFVIIYFASMLAAIKLLEKSCRPIVILSCIVCLFIIWGLGSNMAYAFILLICATIFLKWQLSHNDSIPCES